MWSESSTPPDAGTKKCLNSSLSLPSKKPDQSEELPTPPVQTPVSIPFHWEDAPGKPREDSNSTKPKPKAVRSLDLPPAKKQSPTSSTIMEGVESSSGKGVTHTLSFSFGKLSFRSPEGGGGGNSKRQIGKEGSHRWNLSSWRWGGSFRINNNEVADGGNNMDFSDHLESTTTSPFEFSNMNQKKKKKTMFSKKKKSGSVFNFNFDHSHHPNKSNFLANIYKSFKQAVPWRRKQEGSNTQMA